MNTYRFDVLPTCYGQRIALPDRDLGEATVFGWVAVGVGLFAALFMLAWIGGPVAIGIGMVMKGQLFGYLVCAFGLLGLSGLFATSKIIAFGVAITRNRLGCEVKITDTEVISCEKFGWFSHKVKVDRDKIDSLYLRPLLKDDGSDNAGAVQIDWITKRLPDNIHAIATQPRKGSLIAAGYPIETIAQLAEVLKSELDRNRVGLVSIVSHDDDTTVGTSIERPISIVAETDREAATAPIELPDESSLEVVDQAGTKVYKIPQQGVWKGSHGLMFFALIWNAFLAFVTVAMVVGQGPQGDDFWIALFVLTAFWLVGMSLMIAAFYLGRQSAMIGVRDRSLFIEHKTIFGAKWTEFEPGKLAAIYVGPGNIEVNERPVMELKIQPVGEAAVGMFSQLDDLEICWLAQQLSNELELRQDSVESWKRFFDPKQPIEALEGSTIIVDRSNETTTSITIPKKSLEGHWMLLATGVAFAIGALPVAALCIWQFNADWIVIPIALCGTVTGAMMIICERLYSTRWFKILVTKDSLRIERHGFLSGRQYRIEREKIKAIAMKQSGTRVNNRSFMHLVIIADRGAQGFTLMSGRDEREIAYVAALIDQQLGLSEKGPTSEILAEPTTVSV